MQDSIKAGADIVTFSGDKILSGPQCGVIIGKKKYIDAIKHNPLARALRCDKLTYAALEATLKLYLDEDSLQDRHPVLQLLTVPEKTMTSRSRTFKRHLKKDLEGRCEIRTESGYSQLGSGSLPAQYIPTKVIALKPIHISAEECAAKLRENDPPIFTRNADNEVLLDLRTIQGNEKKTIEQAIRTIFLGEEISNNQA